MRWNRHEGSLAEPGFWPVWGSRTHLPGRTSTSPLSWYSEEQHCCCTWSHVWTDLSTPEISTLGMLFLGHSWNSVNSGFTLLKTVRALGRGWEEAVQQVAKIFPNLCHVFNDQLWEVSGQFEWGHRRDLGRKPWDRSAACCATPKWFLTLVMMDVLIWLIFLLPFNVYCIKSFSLILYPIRATYSMLAMVLQWPNLIAEGRVLYNVVSFSQ